MDKKTILYVDDESINQTVFRSLFRRGYEVLCASGADEGLDLLKNNNVNAVLTDQRMPGISGVEFLRRVRIINPAIPRIIISGYIHDKPITEGLEDGTVQAAFEKPYRRLEVEAFLEKNTSKDA